MVIRFVVKRDNSGRDESEDTTDPGSDVSATADEAGDIFDSLGAEITGLLRQAHRTSDQMVDTASAEAKIIRDEAEVEAKARAREIVERAEAKASDLLTKAQVDVDALCARAKAALERAAVKLEEAETRERTVRKESDALAEEAGQRHTWATEARDRTLDRLRQVQAAAQRLAAESAEVQRQLAEAEADLEEAALLSQAGPSPSAPAATGEDTPGSDVGDTTADQEVIDLRDGAEAGHVGGHAGPAMPGESSDGTVGLSSG